MKISSFMTYEEDSQPKITFACLDTASGETLSKTFHLVQEDSEKAPAYPADRWLKSSDYIVRYTDDTLFSWLKGERIMLETHYSVLEFREFIGLELGDKHVTQIILDDEAVLEQLDFSNEGYHHFREEFESLSDHITDVGNGWEKGCLSLCMLAFSHINRKALAEEAAEKAEASKQRDKEAERKAEAVYAAVKAAQSAETKRRLGEL